MFTVRYKLNFLPLSFCICYKFSLSISTTVLLFHFFTIKLITLAYTVYGLPLSDIGLISSHVRNC
jgi:hypothetical protein